MRQWLLAIVFVFVTSEAMADQRVSFEWLAGNCSDLFRVYRSTASGWIEVAEVTEPSIVITVPNRDVRWRVSGICLSGPSKGEWWSRQGVWTGAKVFTSIKR